MTNMNTNADLYKQILSYRKNAAPGQCLSQLWFVREPNPVYYPRYRCSIEPLIGGEEAFGRIAKDLMSANHSVDIITWGFDPGMVLVRGTSAEDGIRYGDLLKTIATRDKNPVKVRLLVWHDDSLSHAMSNNNPGYYGLRLPIVDRPFTNFYSEHHQAYNDEWYSQVCENKIHNLCLRVRDVPSYLLDQSLSAESVPSSIGAFIAKRYATHHQKMVLIDYEIPKLACGYVMGHNSVTDYWDTKYHKFRDIRRERFYPIDHARLQKDAWKKAQRYDPINAPMSESQQREKERAVQSYLDANSHVGMPFQDVSCRVRGPILYDLNHNFCQGWGESKRPQSFLKELSSLIWGSGAMIAATAAAKISEHSHPEMDPDFVTRRKALALKSFELANGRHNLQLLRTQPLHGEKSAKECYANLTRQMLHYIFIQNQYIQYKPWADHLIECSSRLRAAGYIKPIYVFILTSTPEDVGMDRAAYEFASTVGLSTTMRVEHEESIVKMKKEKMPLPITAEELAGHGLNVFMGSLWSCAQKNGKLETSDYEEIYIHAKVAVVDDAAFTIGSANLNLRSMAFDSELNVLSDAFDVAYKLRVDLFHQCTKSSGPNAFGDMGDTFQQWTRMASQNRKRMSSGRALTCELLPFYVDRKPGIPIV